MTISTPQKTKSFQGLSDLKLIGRQVRFEQLSFWLNPVGALFTIVFSIVFLVLLGSTAGKSTIPYLGNIRYIQYYVPGFVAYGIMSSCFNIQAITLVNRREMGLLKRLRLSPLPTWMLLAAIFLNAMIVAITQVVILLLAGRFGYDVHGPGSWAPFILAIVVGMLSFTALGVGISTLVPNADSAGPIVSITFFLLVALSGLWFPIKAGSGLATFANYFPVRHLIYALLTPFDIHYLPRDTSPWAWHDLLVIGIWGVAGVVVALRRWEWSPRRG